MATGTDGPEDAPRPAGPTPNRERRREPAVIEATAEEVGRETSAEDEDTQEPAADEAQEPEAQMPRASPSISLHRVLPWFAIALGVLALLISVGVGVHLFVTTDGAIVDLRNATAALETRTAGLDRQTARVSALDRRVASLESTLKATATRLASLQNETKKAASLAKAPAATPASNLEIAPLEQRIAAIEAQLKPLAAAVAASKADVSADQDNVRNAVSTSSSAALVVVAQSLLSAVDRGAPFASEVAAARALGASAVQTAALQPLADKGVPTATALAESFAPLAAPVLTGSNSKKPQGILDRLERGASSLVRIRPVGTSFGNNPTALVARIEGALHRGDIAGALSAWDQLSAPAKAVTGDWARSARARLEAEGAAHAILADAIERLGQSKS